MNTIKPVTISLEEFSTLANITPRRVNQLEKQGILKKAKRGKYPISEITSYICYIQATRQEKPEPQEGKLDGEQERARKDKEQADKIALENRVRRGELVEASEVDSAWADIAIAVRSKLLGLGAKLAPRLAGQSKPAIIKREIDTATRQILEDLSKNGDE